MTGSGILPATIHNGKLYFLFGREHNLDSTPGWSDFAGGVEGNDGLMETAIREGTEELTGFLGSEKELAKMMRKHGVIKVNWETYTTHVFPMNYSEELVNYYNNNQRFLQKHLKPKVMKKYKFFEKAEIRWVPFSEFKHLRYKFRPFYKNVIDKIIEKRGEIERFIRRSLRANKTRKCGAKMRRCGTRKNR